MIKHCLLWLAWMTFLLCVWFPLTVFLFKQVTQLLGL